MNIGGYVIVRNGIRLDYCFKEAIESMLKVCDQVVACDSDSDDGTREVLDIMALEDDRIQVVNWPWPKPHAAGGEWFVRWLNFARSHVRMPYQLALDADEILCDSVDCHTAIAEAIQCGNSRRMCHRINYWLNAGRLCVVPNGHLVGTYVTRLGDTLAVMTSDANITGGPTINDGSILDTRIRIHHVGFIRDTAAFYEKSKVCLAAWNGGYDDRLTRAEAAGVHQTECDVDFRAVLQPYDGFYLPKVVKSWMKQRGVEL